MTVTKPYAIKLPTRDITLPVSGAVVRLRYVAPVRMLTAIGELEALGKGPEKKSAIELAENYAAADAVLRRIAAAVVVEPVLFFPTPGNEAAPEGAVSWDELTWDDQFAIVTEARTFSMKATPEQKAEGEEASAAAVASFPRD